MKTPTFVLFLSLHLFLMDAKSQTDALDQEVSKVAARIDRVTATRTKELVRSGITMPGIAMRLAYQGIDASSLNELKAQGLDVQVEFRKAYDNSLPINEQVRAAALFADCIVIGVVRKVDFVPGARLNKYVYVDVEQWLKGKRNDRGYLVLRSFGSYQDPTYGALKVSHEMPLEAGERILLLLSKAMFELYIDEAPYDTERYKEDYGHMYRLVFGDKIKMVGDTFIRFSGSKEMKRQDATAVLNSLKNVIEVMRKARKGGSYHE